MPASRGDDPARDDDHHDREDRIEDGAVRAPALHHEQIDENDDRNEMMDAGEEGRAERRNLCRWQPPQTEFRRLEMGNVEQREIAEDGRNCRCHDHVEVGDSDELGNDEGGSAHDRRHDLAVGRCSDLDGAGLHRRHADPPHDGNRECSRGDHIGDRRAGNHARHARRQDRRLGRASAEAPDHGEGEGEEVLPRTGLVEQRAKQHEQEDKADRNAEGDAEDGLACQPLISDQPRQAEPLVRDDVGHRLAEDRVDQEDAADDDQRDSDRAARGVQQEQDAGTTEDGLHRNAVPDVEQAMTGDEAAPTEEEIGSDDQARDRQGDIPGRQPALPPAPRHRIDQETEQQCEREMETSCRHITDDGEVQHEGKG